mgnify:CR=1 FL=1
MNTIVWMVPCFVESIGSYFDLLSISIILQAIMMISLGLLIGHALKDVIFGLFYALELLMIDDIFCCGRKSKKSGVELRMSVE